MLLPNSLNIIQSMINKKLNQVDLFYVNYMIIINLWQDNDAKII